MAIPRHLVRRVSFSSSSSCTCPSPSSTHFSRRVSLFSTSANQSSEFGLGESTGGHHDRHGSLPPPTSRRSPSSPSPYSDPFLPTSRSHASPSQLQEDRRAYLNKAEAAQFQEVISDYFRTSFSRNAVSGTEAKAQSQSQGRVVMPGQRVGMRSVPRTTASKDGIRVDVQGSATKSTSSTTSPSSESSLPPPGTSNRMLHLLSRAKSLAHRSSLRQHSQFFQREAVISQMLDLTNAEINSCKSDGDLLLWCYKEVFHPAKTLLTPLEEGGKRDETFVSIYPKLISKLMERFRNSFQDPNLSLSIFQVASQLSPHSNLLGCTTPVYNQVLKTKWECFRDVEGSLKVVEEMRLQGLRIDDETVEVLEGLGETLMKDEINAVVKAEEEEARKRADTKDRSDITRTGKGKREGKVSLEAALDVRVSPENEVQQQFNGILSHQLPDEIVDRYRTFSAEDLAAWNSLGPILRKEKSRLQAIKAEEAEAAKNSDLSSSPQSLLTSNRKYYEPPPVLLDEMSLTEEDLMEEKMKDETLRDAFGLVKDWTDPRVLAQQQKPSRRTDRSGGRDRFGSMGSTSVWGSKGSDAEA